MGKHIKTSRGRPVDPPKHENWKRRQRRKRLKARRSGDFATAWIDRALSERVNGFPQVPA